jgi:hypothetical protein
MGFFIRGNGGARASPCGGGRFPQLHGGCARRPGGAPLERAPPCPRRHGEWRPFSGTRVALAMAEVLVEADLTGVSGFPAGEELCYHEDLVARYGPARTAVAAHVPAVQVLARLPHH